MQEKLNNLLGETRRVKGGYRVNLEQLTGGTIVKLSKMLTTGMIQDVKIKRSGTGLVVVIDSVW